MQRLVDGAAPSRSRPGSGSPPTSWPTVLGRPDGPVALKHLLRTNHDARAAAPPAPAAGDRRVPQPRGRRRGRAATRRPTADASGCASARSSKATTSAAALRFSAPLMPFAIEVIATLDRDDPAYVARRGQRGRVGARRPAPDPVRPAERRQGRRGRPAEGRGRAVRGAHGAARGDHLAAARWPSCSTPASPRTASTTRGSPSDPSPKSILREMLESGDTFATFVRPLPARTQRGAGAALPHRRVAHPRPLAARRRLHRRRSRTSSNGSAR